MDANSPAITLVTAHHTGTHSALFILEQYYLRHAITEDWRRDVGVEKPPMWFSHAESAKMHMIRGRIGESEHLIMTVRDPNEVVKSWVRRGKPMVQGFKDMWTNLFALQDEFNGMWLPVDTPDRDMRLEAISERVGHEIKTDWERKGVTGNRQEFESGMTCDEALSFLKQFPFEQFGYEI